MFKFFFTRKSGETVDLLDVIGASLEKINLAVLAEEKAIGMIAKAIAKSEIMLTNGRARVRDEIYYRLNIQPNDNQSGTDFWYEVVGQMLRTGECLVVRASGKFYVATAYTASNDVLKEKKYTAVTITDGVDEITLRKTFSAGDVLLFQYESEKIRNYRKNVLGMYNEILSALMRMIQISNTPIFKYKVGANMAFRTRDRDGQERRLTIDEVIDKIKSQIAGRELAVIQQTEGTELIYLDIPTKVSAADVNTMSERINDACAMAYDIPKAVFSGTITEKSDATNEFITYAVQPPAEAISDQLNAKLIGPEDYIKGERAYVWLAHFRHVDVIDVAASLDKLRGIGFTLDEIFEMVGYPKIGTEFSQTRALTKNYATEFEQTERG